MSNNAPDYENNLAFPPQEIKSQDDIRKPEQRKSDVLIAAIEKCEKLEKQLETAKAGLLSIGTWLTCNPKDMKELMPDLCIEQECLNAVNRTLELIKELDK
jgi:hypothetical protein